MAMIYVRYNSICRAIARKFSSAVIDISAIRLGYDLYNGSFC